MLRKFAWLWGISAAIIAGLAWAIFSGKKKEPFPLRNALPLESYRQQFARPDGSLPDDAELIAILNAKGIPFQAQAACSNNDCAPATPLVHTLPAVEFRTNKLSAARREELSNFIRQVVARELENLRAQAPELRIERIAVSEGMKLELYFNREFSRIADEETQLFDFSARLHDLGNTELRGTNFFIEDKPLGVYLKTKDAERNKEASALPAGEIGGESVR